MRMQALKTKQTTNLLSIRQILAIKSNNHSIFSFNALYFVNWTVEIYTRHTEM